jgi:hypothetical protein
MFSLSHTPIKLIVSSFFLASVIAYSLSTPSLTQAEGWSLTTKLEGSPKELIVGDRVDLTFRVWANNEVPITHDQKFTFKIANPKPGQECFTTDDNVKGDGTVKGYCEAKGDSGNMEVWVDTDARTTFEVNGVYYSPMAGGRYNAMFNDPKETCAGGQTAPSSIKILKQNDVTAKLEWQQPATFVGSYDVLYGTTPGEYPSKRRSTEKSIIVDGLDPSKVYYFKVQANSACKWTATSKIFKYAANTGSVSETSEKAATVSATPKATSKPSPNASVKPSASPSVQPSVSPSPSLIPTSLPQPMVATAVETNPEPTTFTARVFSSVKSFFQKLKFW